MMNFLSRIFAFLRSILTAAPAQDGAPGPEIPGGVARAPGDAGAAAEDAPEGDDDEPEVEPPAVGAKRDGERITIRCRPTQGEYLIDEAGACVCGKGECVGAGWIRRRWPPAHRGAYKYITRTRDDHKGHAQWTPNIREAGEYAVYALIPATSNRTSKAVYVVRHALGTTQVAMDQRGYVKNDIMRWRKLGVFSFRAGMEGYVRLLNTRGHSEGADALGMRRYVAP